MLKNDYNPSTNTFSFVDVGLVFNGGGCPNHYGIGIDDLGVRFADIDGLCAVATPQYMMLTSTPGDGLADYLCIDPDGRTTAWLNKGSNNFISQGQIKIAVGADRANVRFADIDGDVRHSPLFT